MTGAPPETPSPPGAARWELLAGAVAGRRLVVVAGDGERAYCDGERIYTASGEGGPSRDSLVVQASLVAIGSLQPRIVARLAGRRRVRHRYLVLEAVRACHELRDVMPRGVAQRITDTYDGPPSDSPQQSLARATSQDWDVDEAPAWMGTIRPARVLMSAPMPGGSQLTDAQRAAAARHPDLPQSDEDEETEGTDLLDSLRAPTSQSRLLQYLQKLMGLSTSPSPDQGASGNELPVGMRSPGRVAGDGRSTTEDIDVELHLDGPAIGRLYPEYDLQRGRYREDWCAVTAYDPRPAAHEARLPVTEDRRLRRELARLGLAHERHRRQEEGDTLDLGALIDFVVDRRSGVSGDPRVYELKRRTAHDLGVLVLLDTSGSTGEGDGGSRVFDEQREVAARLTAAFDELGDRVATYGFQSWGRHRVEFLRVKGFDDPYDHAAQRRLAALEPGGFTRLGAAIRHATYLLSSRAGASNTLLVVVGDGLPYDDGYEQNQAHEDCRRALQEAVVAGVGCACVSVRSATRAAVTESVWGNVPHRSLDHPSDLARHVGPLFLSALKEAAASRRLITSTLGHPMEVA